MQFGVASSPSLQDKVQAPFQTLRMLGPPTLWRRSVAWQADKVPFPPNPLRSP